MKQEKGEHQKFEKLLKGMLFDAINKDHILELREDTKN